jgi:hypothetical protein
MDPQEQQLIDRIKQAQNILVTVSANPSVDQLSAAIGLTVALNKMNKHGTAVFSGQVPSTMEFLKPEDTLEKNTDSLRDFIIALDKSKADKLRYKVEDQVVRIFITPYRTSLSQDDLEFSQGDFNVDVVVALGVADQKDIDAAITAHGRILHDATVAAVSLVGQGDLGTINWVDTDASSLSEMILGLVDGLDKKLLDNQIATALLTGIVASTDRFRNEKTSPKAMSASAELMAAGANQQLIATELDTQLPAPEPVPAEAPPKQPEQQAPSSKRAEPGELDIEHVPGERLLNDDEDNHKDEKQYQAPPAYSGPAPETPGPQPARQPADAAEAGPQSPVHYDEPLPAISQVHGVESDGLASDSGAPEAHRERLASPPSLGNVNLTANTSPEGFEPATEELTLPVVSAPLLTHNETVLPPGLAPMPEPTSSPFIPQAPLQPSPQSWLPPEPLPVPPPAPNPVPPIPAPDPPSPVAPVAPRPDPNPVITLPPAPVFTPAPMAPPFSPASASLIPSETLEEIEEAVHSPHVQAATNAAAAAAASLDDARNAVQAAFSGAAVPSAPPSPIAALNAQPLGADLHQSAVAAPPVPNMGFSEPTPGNTPADATLDMPLPSNPFGPGRQAGTSALPGAFPGTAPQQGGGSSGVPPVPPPFVPPMQ